MKFIVGYQMTGDREFISRIIEHKEHIKEVYFSFGDMPNGRGALPEYSEQNAFSRMRKQEEDLHRISDAGIAMNLLFNGNCYGAESQSRALFNKIGETVEHVRASFGLSSVTTASPLIAKFIRSNFSGIDVRASVNMEIGTVEGIDYLEGLFDSFYVKRECNRNKAQLDILSKRLRELGRGMYLIANSGCLNFCSARTFHDNLVSHESEISKMDNGYDFKGACHAYLESEENRVKYLSRINVIRPEDISLYEEYTDAVKLATRVSRDPVAVLDAYVKGSYSAALTSLTEPDHTASFFPYVIENSKLPEDFGKTVMTCDHRCEICGYCESAYRQALVSLEKYNI